MVAGFQAQVPRGNLAEAVFGSYGQASEVPWCHLHVITDPVGGISDPSSLSVRGSEGIIARRTRGKGEIVATGFGEYYLLRH